MTPQSVLTEVRQFIKDNDSVAYRNSDNDLLLMVNRALKRVAMLRPDLYTTIGTITLVAGVLQTVPNKGRIMEVFGVTGGNATPEVNRETLDTTVPGWRSATAGTTVNWCRHSRDNDKFFVSPPSNGTGTLDAEYTISPSTLALADPIPLAEIFEPVVVDITVAEVEWADDENVLNQRAEAFYKRAQAALGVNLQERTLTDTEGGGVQGAID